MSLLPDSPSLKNHEELLKKILYAPYGLNKVAHSIVTVLEYKAPQIVKDVKGTNSLELLGAAHKILAEEMNKSDKDLFQRIQKRIDDYWIGE